MPDDDGLTLRAPGEEAEPPEPWSRRLRRWGRDLLITVLGVGLLFFGLARLRAPELPEAAPDFDLPNLEGAQLRLSELRGRPVVLNFWATWCGPCELELPLLTSFSKKHPDVPVLFVAVDGAPVALQAFAQAHDMPPAQVLRIDAATAKAYAVSTLPTTVVVEADGSVGSVHAGVLAPLQLSWMTGRW